MNKFYEHLLSVLLVLTFLNGCSALPMAEGQVMPLSQQVTMQGMYAALNGAQLSARFFVKGDLGVIQWPQSGGWAWVCVKCSVQDPVGMFQYLTGGQGNIANAETVSGMTKFMLADGWKELTAKAGPTAILAGENVGAFLSQMSGAITGIMIVPIMPVEVTETVKG